MGADCYLCNHDDIKLCEDCYEKMLEQPYTIWGRNGLSESEDLTPEFIEENIHKPWDWEYLSENPSITPEFIERHLDKPWVWGKWGLSGNRSITPEFIERHLNKPWDWNELSKNRNLTRDFIRRYSDKLKYTKTTIEIVFGKDNLLEKWHCHCDKVFYFKTNQPKMFDKCCSGCMFSREAFCVRIKCEKCYEEDVFIKEETVPLNKRIICRNCKEKCNNK